MNIKAIETVYKGYRFRSRLEARWAVFFDALGVPYEYEKEGYDLDGMWYLPDFWLPEQKCWVEIKPDSACLASGYLQAGRLARASGQDAWVFCGGQFDSSLTDGYCFRPDHDRDEYVYTSRWAECMECLLDRLIPKVGSEGTDPDGAKSITLIVDPARPPAFVGIPGSEHWRQHTQGIHHLAEGWCDETKRLTAAYNAARQARFEYGEHGAPR